MNIWLTETRNEETDQKDGTWRLTAANYMPRTGIVADGMYEAVSSSREELAELIKKHVLPLYETAVKKLKGICEETDEGLYYWKE